LRSKETRRVECLWIFEQVWVLDKHAVRPRRQLGAARRLL
jgi:hypothetical protein